MKTMIQQLEKDGSLGFNIAFYNRFSNIGDMVYSDICGGFNEGVHQWASHNLEDFIQCENDKYFGWTLIFNLGGERYEKKVYIPRWVMEVKPKNWKHAKNLFNKYLIEAK